jgi:ABC-type polysaccharide/polyol phosphate transport system ATPase subunit/ABC-type polysaccharide/polyol phosphate export permease
VSKTFESPLEPFVTMRERVAGGFKAREKQVLNCLEDVSFEVRRGECFGIAGRNGSGKSTLLRCISQIYRFDTGSIDVDGNVAALLDLTGCFNPDLNARENVMLNGVIRGLSRREARRRTDEILDFAELSQFADMKVRNFSAGMSMRLGYSIASHVEADVLVVDEALAVGDDNFRAKCFAHLQRLKDGGGTVLFVTHRMDELERFCDRALLLDGGRVRAVGEPGEIAREYERVNEGARPSAPIEGETEEEAARMASRKATSAHDALPLRRRMHQMGEQAFTMAQAEFKLHYQESALGYVWAALRPLMLFGVLYFVLSQVVSFGRGVHHYPVYLLTAIVLWTFFSEATSNALPSMVRNAALLRTVRFPKPVVPLATVMLALFNLGVNFVAVMAFVFISGITPAISWLEVPVLVVLLAALASGASLFISAAFVRFRDIGQIWTVSLQLLFYASPILFVSARYPESVREVLSASPLATVFTQVRHAFIDPTSASATGLNGFWLGLVAPLAVGGLVLTLGIRYFRHESPQMAERL